MKMISKIAGAGLGLMFLGSSVFAQSLADAKKAIDAEQYQKAKSMLKNLTTTQADKDENYFYLGWVYLKQEYPDSAKAIFNKGLTVNSKSPLNMVGIGAVAHIEKDNATATNNFNQAIALAGKSSTPYLYIGLSYLLPVNGSSKGINGSKISPADADAAIAVLTKGKTVNPKDAWVLIALGDAYRSQLKSNDAYTSYNTALSMEKTAAANVALGVLWQYADNFDGSRDQFKAALAIDPNYGPAYREWAETDLRETPKDPTKYDALVKDAVEQYKKYISLTDYSVESQMRYADFLVRSKDYVTLQKVATDLSTSKNSNLRVYRYLGYAAFENKDYPAAETALSKWIKEADASRLLPTDYLYLGRAQLQEKKDSVGIQTLRTALKVDTSQVDLYGEIAVTLYNKQQWADAAEAFKIYTSRSRNATLNDHFKMGFSYYQIYKGQLIKQQTVKTIIPDTTMLAKADTEFTYIARKLGPKVPPIMVYYHANVKDFEDNDRNNIKGLAKPLFEQYVQIMTAKASITPDDKTQVAVAYAYLGNYAENKEKDSAKALDLYTKGQQMDPENPQVKYYFATKKGGGKSK